jgi:hypothetical protein
MTKRIIPDNTASMKISAEDSSDNDNVRTAATISAKVISTFAVNDVKMHTHSCLRIDVSVLLGCCIADGIVASFRTLSSTILMQ